MFTTSLRHAARACTLSLTALLFLGIASLPAAEKTVTLSGRIETAGLDLPPGQFTVRALRPQKRDVQFARTTADAAGNFQLAIDEEAFALYGVLLEAASAANPGAVLQAAVLRQREAESSITINPSSTMEAAVLNWRVKTHGNDVDLLRPLVLFDWLRPISQSRTRERLQRAGTVLVRWAVSAAPSSQSAAAILVEALGDVRQIGRRLTALKVAPAAVSQLEDTAKKDAEVAYLLMMPYFLEL